MSTTKRTLWMLILVVAVGALLYPLFRTPKQRTDSRVSIRLKWLHQAQFAGFYAAEMKGFYGNEGVTVALKPGGVEFPAISAVTSGSDQFGVAGADQVLTARAAGAPIVAVAVIYRATPMVLFSSREKNILDAKSMIGKRVGVKLGGNEELTYRAILHAAGVNSHQVNEIPVKYDMTPLFDNLVDVWPGYLINEVLSAREHGYELNIIRPSEYGLHMYADTLFTTEDVVRQKPELVRKVVEATLHGWQYAAAQPEEAARFGMSYDGKLNYDHELAMMRESIPLLKPDDKPIGWMEPSEWEGLQRLLVEQGFLKQPIDLSSVVDYRFVRNYYGGHQ